MAIYGITTVAEAEEMVDKSDRHRRRFIETMTGAHWTDSRNYHLAIDTGMIGFPAAEKLIIDLVSPRCN